MRDPRDIIIKPLVTEKSTALMEDNKYSFVVAKEANKIEIKKAVEEIFKVRVKAVNTIRMKGKKKRLGRYEGFRPDWKKAIVTLSEDSKPIELFESR
ncbi:MAG: 50S ribosomal protein L23 [Dethiobacteria bacterium]|jgi:large subunit ribosomal protein L23|nr:50S ribosomal protein L23 [Bacillota bacterium]